MLAGRFGQVEIAVRPPPSAPPWHNLGVPTAHDGGQSQPHRLQVVLFSGGRGSGALTRQLIASPAIDLTLAINGYDDGASTGEVRRFLGDSLGPSDFRKNASTLAATLRTCPAALIELLDLRFPRRTAMRPTPSLPSAEWTPARRATRAARWTRHCTGPSSRWNTRGAPISPPDCCASPTSSGRPAVASTSRTAASATWSLPARSSSPIATSTRRWTTTAGSSACRLASSRTSPTAPMPSSWPSTPTAGCSRPKRRSSMRHGPTASATST